MSDYPREVALGFAESLRRCRKRADLSQEELGYRAGLHRTEVGLLERGARVPRIDTVLKLAGGLGISPCELILGLAWEPGRRRVTPGRFDLSRRGE